MILQCARLALACVLALSVASPAWSSGGDAQSLVRAAVENLPTASFQSKITLTTAQGPRFLELSQKRKEDGTRQGYLEVVGPGDLAGIRHLFLEPKDAPPTQYLKLTASRSIVRVAAETRSQPFLGSTFYIADLVEPPTQGWRFAFVGDVELLGRNCKLVEGTPLTPEAEIYGKVVAAIDPTDKVVLRRQFFDKKGNLFKTWQVEKLVKVQGYLTPLVQDMRNLQDGSESRLEITEINYGVDIPDSVFTPEHLKR